MQAHAPEGALGRVFVRYEVMFQLAWVAGAVGPALLPIDFKDGILIMAGFYVALAGGVGRSLLPGRPGAGRSIGGRAVGLHAVPRSAEREEVDMAEFVTVGDADEVPRERRRRST